MTNDVAALQSSLDHPPGFDDFDRNIASARGHLAATRNDAAAAAQGDRSQACSTSYQAQSDVYSLQSDSYGVDGDTVPVTEYIRTIGWTVAGLNRDVDAYHAAVTSAAGYRPPAAPEDATVRTAIDNAHSAAARLKSRSDAAKSTVTQLVTQAGTIANRAVKQHC